MSTASKACGPKPDELPPHQAVNGRSGAIGILARSRLIATAVKSLTTVPYFVVRLPLPHRLVLAAAIRPNQISS